MNRLAPIALRRTAWGRSCVFGAVQTL